MKRDQTLEVVWFKRDLRVEDHRPLAQAQAAAQCAGQGAVLPLYIAEPEFWQLPDASARQWAFVAEGLESLQAALSARGQGLCLRTGDAVAVLEALRQAFPNMRLWSHEETGNAWTFARDRRVAAWASTHGIEWREIQPAGVIRVLERREGWARRWDRLMAEPVTPPPEVLQPVPDIPLGSVPDAAALGLLPDLCPERQPGGRDAALERLNSFLHQRGQSYRRAMSGPAAGAAHCSRLSPHLAWGTISMREVAQAGLRRSAEVKTAGRRDGWTGSLSSFQARLHWRDHFTQKLEDQPGIEFRNFHPAYDGLRPTEPDAARLAAWSTGETGLPFVDACMRALNATGWMNFRMRAMLMAVASYHLWLDWRAPGEHLARQFTDYEPGIHWPQVQMQSGTTGINTVRIYNPVKQGHDQDPDGAFVRRWVPELQGVPDAFIHEPWRWEQAGSLLDRAYPAPIVDHLAAAKAARQQVWSVRGQAGFRSEAQAIQDRHGSRKSGVPGPRRRARKTDAKPSPQLDLPLT